MKDTQLFESVERELNRQRNNIELIASENFVSEEVLQLAGSVLINKYAEGYPAKRYYGGCQFVDEVEELARQRICEIYGAEHANVQPHSGAQANTAVYLALLQHGDKVLGMSLADGGHLTHGHPLNFSGINYEFYSYGVSKETETIDYEAYKKQVEEIKPKLVVAGGTDNHLLLVDVKASCGISGKKAQRLLDEINITANKNAIPFDTEKPFKASGIRIGTPAMTTKGFKEEDFEEVARIIAYRLKNEETDEIKEECLKRVAKLTEKVTMYSNIKYI